MRTTLALTLALVRNVASSRLGLGLGQQQRRESDPQAVASWSRAVPVWTMRYAVAGRGGAVSGTWRAPAVVVRWRCAHEFGAPGPLARCAGRGHGRPAATLRTCSKQHGWQAALRSPRQTGTVWVGHCVAQTGTVWVGHCVARLWVVPWDAGAGLTATQEHASRPHPAVTQRLNTLRCVVGLADQRGRAEHASATASAERGDGARGWGCCGGWPSLWRHHAQRYPCKRTRHPHCLEANDWPWRPHGPVRMSWSHGYCRAPASTMSCPGGRPTAQRRDSYHAERCWPHHPIESHHVLTVHNIRCDRLLPCRLHHVGRRSSQQYPGTAETCPCADTAALLSEE